MISRCFDGCFRSPSNVAFISCRWNVLWELQPHRKMHTMHKLRWAVTHGEAMHGHWWCDLRVRLRLFHVANYGAVPGVYGMSIGQRRAETLQPHGGHHMWDLHGWHILRPGERAEPLPTMHHLRRYRGTPALHPCQRHGVPRYESVAVVWWVEIVPSEFAKIRA